MLPCACNGCRCCTAPMETEEMLREHRSDMEMARNDLMTGVRRNAIDMDDSTAKMFNSQQYSDITLLVGERTFYAHRLILSSWSDVFKTMLCDPTWQLNHAPPNDTSDDLHPQCVMRQELVEEEPCALVFKDFLKFMYSSSVSLTKDNVLPLTRLADKYLVAELRKLCQQFIEDTKTDLEAVISLLQEALKFRMSIEFDSCIQSLRTNFNLLTSDQIICLDSEIMVALLDSGFDLVVDDEYTLFTKLEPWLDDCPDDDTFVQIIKLIRFPYMDAGQLKQATNSSAFIRALTIDPEMHFNIWQMKTLYDEGDLGDLPPDFPWPRTYLGVNGGKTSIHGKPTNRSTEVNIRGDRTRIEEHYMWMERPVGENVFFTLLKQYQSGFHITASLTSDPQPKIDVKIKPTSLSNGTCHVVVEAKIPGGLGAKEESQYFTFLLFPSRIRSFHCIVTSALPNPEKVLIRLTAIQNSCKAEGEKEEQEGGEAEDEEDDEEDDEEEDEEDYDEDEDEYIFYDDDDYDDDEDYDYFF